MKKLIFLCVFAIGTVSCLHNTSPSTTSAYKPILMDRKSLANSIKFEAAKDLNKPGKICISGNFMYVTEPFSGVHVFNNTDPTKPINTGFITVPGIQTISIKNNTLFADNSTDLLAINITNPTVPIVSTRLENIMPWPGVPDNLPLDTPVSQLNWPANAVVVGWEGLK